MFEPIPSGDKFKEFSDNPFVSAHEQKTSTFSVDADGASYSIMRRYLGSGYKIDPQSVRIEEFLNYFTFDYPDPDDGNAVKINGEIGVCPWNQGNYLLRLGVKGQTVETLPLSNLVFLIDVSGSMYSSDKLPLFKKCLTTLVKNLNPEDRISIVTYSGDVRRLLESTPAKAVEKITSAIQQLKADGCTNGGFALKMAYEEALNNFKFAASVAAYGMLLRDSKYKGSATYGMVKNLVSESLDFDPQGYRAEFLELVSKAEK